MFLDIFSSFDDCNNVIFNISYFIWIVTLLVSLAIFRNVSVISILSVSASNSGYMLNGLYGRSRIGLIGGSSSLVVSLCATLVTLNCIGLIPYVFSVTSHLAVNMVLGFSVWLTIVLMGLTFSFSSFLAHLQPLGAPAVLSPFLCIIELVSLLVRPLTLSVRLTANLSTGHILIALLGSGFISSGSAISLLMLVVGMLYFMFEMGVCIIQAYIFTLLPTLYADEHPFVICNYNF